MPDFEFVVGDCVKCRISKAGVSAVGSLVSADGVGVQGLGFGV